MPRGVRSANRRNIAPDADDDSGSDAGSTTSHHGTSLSTLLKLIPLLSVEGFDVWLHALQQIAYTDNWYDPALFGKAADGTITEWTPATFTDTHTSTDLTRVKDRRNCKKCYTIMFVSCKNLQHLFEAIVIGDTGAAFAAISDAFNRNTISAFIAAQKAFLSTNMLTDPVNLSQFIALIASRAKRLSELDNDILRSDKEKTAILLEGLLPEFSAIRIHILATSSTKTFLEISKECKDLAVTLKLKDLRNGG